MQCLPVKAHLPKGEFRLNKTNFRGGASTQEAKAKTFLHIQSKCTFWGGMAQEEERSSGNRKVPGLIPMGRLALCMAASAISECVRMLARVVKHFQWPVPF